MSRGAVRCRGACIGDLLRSELESMTVQVHQEGHALRERRESRLWQGGEASTTASGAQRSGDSRKWAKAGLRQPGGGAASSGELREHRPFVCREAEEGGGALPMWRQPLSR